MRKLECEPGTEFSGAAMLSIVENVMSTEYLPLIEKYGYKNISPDAWYPLQDFFNFLNELFEMPNQMFNLVAIGMTIAETALMPPELGNPTLEEMVESWDAHYQINFRNGYVGLKTTTRLDDRHYKVVLDGTKMPDDLEYGVLYGFARRFLPPGVHFLVWYDEDVLPMDKGGDQTVLHVSWE